MRPACPPSELSRSPSSGKGYRFAERRSVRSESLNPPGELTQQCSPKDPLSGAFQGGIDLGAEPGGTTSSSELSKLVIAIRESRREQDVWGTFLGTFTLSQEFTASIAGNRPPTTLNGRVGRLSGWTVTDLRVVTPKSSSVCKALADFRLGIGGPLAARGLWFTISTGGVSVPLRRCDNSEDRSPVPCLVVRLSEFGSGIHKALSSVSPPAGSTRALEVTVRGSIGKMTTAGQEILRQVKVCSDKSAELANIFFDHPVWRRNDNGKE